MRPCSLKAFPMKQPPPLDVVGYRNPRLAKLFLHLKIKHMHATKVMIAKVPIHLNGKEHQAYMFKCVVDKIVKDLADDAQDSQLRVWCRLSAPDRDCAEGHSLPF